MAALACALITLGSPHPDVIQAILQTLLELHVSEITDGHYIKFLSLALGLCYLGMYFGFVVIYISMHRWEGNINFFFNL